MLHAEVADTSVPTTSKVKPETRASSMAIRSNIDVLLPTAVVKVRVGNRLVLARALIDSCSQINLVTESFVIRNHFAKRSSASSVVRVSPSSVKMNHVISVSIESRYNDTQIRVNAEVIGSLLYNIEPHGMRHIELLNTSIQHADNGLNSTSVHLLISAEFAYRITTC